MMQVQENTTDLGWMLTSLVDRVRGIQSCLAVSADGLMLAMGGDMDREHADRLSAASSAMIGLAVGTAAGGDRVEDVLIELTTKFYFLTRISEGSLLFVIADHDCDPGVVSYEMGATVERVGAMLTPALIAQLKAEQAG